MRQVGLNGCTAKRWDVSLPDTGCEFEVVFGDRSMTPAEIQEIVLDVVGESRLYAFEADEGLIGLGTASDRLQDHVIIVPGGGAMQHFYAKGRYGNVRVRTHRWLIDTSPVGYSSVEHGELTRSIAEKLAEETGGEVRTFH